MTHVLQRVGTNGTFRWCAWGAGLAMLAFACEPDWSELTSDTGEAARGGSASGSAGSPVTSGSGGTSDNSGGMMSAGGSSGAAGEPGDSGGEPMAGGAGAGGAPGVPEPIDLPGTASADSEEIAKGNVAANGHDGDNATRWVAADGALGHYWTLDLGSPHSLAHVTIRWEYPFGVRPDVYLYTISVSDDGVTYQVALDKGDNQETTQDQVAELPSGTTGRYVRITVTGLPPLASGEYWASFYEARVFGFPP